MGGAGIASGAYTIIAFAVPPVKRAAFTGILGAVYGCASVIGPLLGGVFTSKATWRWWYVRPLPFHMIPTNIMPSFYVNLPVGGASALVILLFFQTPSASKPAKASKLEKFLQMDPLGTVVIMGAIVSYLLALQWGGTTKPWSSGDVIGTLVAFAVLTIAFVVVEWWMGDRAILQGSLMKRRDIIVPCVFNFLSVSPSPIP